MRRTPFALLLLFLVAPLQAQVGSPAPMPPPHSIPQQHVDPPAMQSPSLHEEEVRDLAPVVVSGVHSGPGMWRVSRDGKVLHLLGTLSPLPRDIEWMSRDVEAAIASSQEVLQSPSVAVGSDIGIFRGMLLIPKALKARRNPDGKMLSDVVSAEDYARWSALKARYIGRDRKVEQWRPVFAAQELYSAAIRKSGLSTNLLVEPMIAKAAKRHNVPSTRVQVGVVIEDPKTALRDFSSGALDDSACFERTLVRIESDLDAMRLRANAWAVGDLEQLRALPYTDQYTSCISALTSTALAQRLRVADLRAQMEQKWLAEAQRALAENQSTFAALPIREMLGHHGLLSKLEALGYEVQAP